MWNVRESIEIDEVVAVPSESRLSSGSNPLRSSSGNSLKSEIKAVCLCRAARLMKISPPTMAQMIPTVAVVMPKLCASSQPSS